MPTTSDDGERGRTHGNNALASQPEPRPAASTGKSNKFKFDPDGKPLREILEDDGGGESGDRAGSNRNDPDAPRECQKVSGSGHDQNTDPKGFDEAVTIAGGVGNEDSKEEHRNRLNSMSSGQKRVGIGRLRGTDKTAMYSALPSTFLGLTTKQEVPRKGLKESRSDNRGSDEDGVSRVSGVDSIDEDQVLDKLLDETTPPAIFRENHHTLMQKLLKSQVRIQMPNTVRCCRLKG